MLLNIVSINWIALIYAQVKKTSNNSYNITLAVTCLILVINAKYFFVSYYFSFRCIYFDAEFKY